MTGLDPEKERIIEIATIVTDAQLNILEEGPVLAIHQADALLDAMDKWNTRTHNATGLVSRVQSSRISESDAERETIAFLKRYIVGNRAPLCGNSICQDRRFLYRYMPKLSDYLHYRNIDVSSIKELVKRWRPDIVDGFDKKGTHKALDDIRESIAELQYYREHFLIDVKPQ